MRPSWRRRSCRASRGCRQTWGIGARHRRAARHGDGKGGRARGHHELSTFGLLKDETGRRDPRLHRAAGRRRPARARRRSVSGAAADVSGRGAAARRWRRARSTARRQPRGRGSGAGLHDARQSSHGRSTRELFEALREVRLRLARERGVPPYVIFHDTTLRDMAAAPAEDDRRSARESTASARRKAADFGDAFLDAIRRA